MFTSKVGNRLVFFTALFGAALLFSHCSKSEFNQESFAPSNIHASIKTVSANGGGSLYCSISGGCSLNITGSDFYEGAKVFIGSYECTKQVVAVDHNSITCTVGPGKSGVFEVSVINIDGKTSIFDKSVLDTTTLNFSYASFLYLGVQDTPGTVYAYAQNPVTGALLSITGSPFSIAAGANSTYGTVISPNNKFLFAANVGSNSISVFAINAVNGRLTAVGAPIAAGITGPNGLFFHPSGNFLYVSSFSSTNMAGFSVAGDGSLTPIAGSPFSAGVSSINNGVVVHSSGNFLYTASMSGSGGVVGFSIDPTTGALTLLPGSPFRNNNGGFSNTGDGITIHPNGRWLYLGLVGQKRVAAFDIDNLTGILTGIGTPILNNSTTGYTDNGGSGANISPDGLYFYGTAYSTNAAHPKKVIVYSIAQTSGDLTLSSEADAGGGPNDIRVDTNGIFAYTCNSANAASVSAFSRNAGTGALSPLSPRDVMIPTGGPGIMVIQR